MIYNMVNLSGIQILIITKLKYISIAYTSNLSVNYISKDKSGRKMNIGLLK